ncbi:MAG: formylglycine-generating enzyme family protein [Gallionellaceae bacterium]
MKKRIILISLMLGLHVVAGNAQAEKKHNHAAADKQHASKPVAGTLWTEPKTRMKFVWVPSGCFRMGGDGHNEQPVHQVCVKGFWMGRYEVTQAQYQQVIGINPSNFIGSNRPVDQVSWDDASNFTQEMSYSTGTKVRLPSEAEWEYACRAGGAHEKYCGGGGKPDRLAWYKANSKGRTHPVGQLAPNAWGLYDMSGNVWEWTQDCYNGNYNGAPADGSAWKSGNCGRRMLRGGAWYDDRANLRAADRNDDGTGDRINNNGFRVVRTLP